jgi:hypothetical protein
MNTGDERGMRRASKVKDITVAKMISALMDGPCTALELVHVSGLAKMTVYAYMRAMRKERCAYICGWEPDAMGRDAHMIYALGRSKDVPRKKRTVAENTAAYKARRKQLKIENAFRAVVSK